MAVIVWICHNRARGAYGSWAVMASSITWGERGGAGEIWGQCMVVRRQIRASHDLGTVKTLAPYVAYCRFSLQGAGLVRTVARVEREPREQLYNEP